MGAQPTTSILPLSWTLIFRSTGLILVPATFHLARIERLDGAELARALGANVPGAWPPPLTDDTLDYWVGRLEADPGLYPWAKWYVLLEAGAKPDLIGVFGFKGQPASRCVEIGYSLVEDYQRRGLGTRAVGLLLEWGRATGLVDTVRAETFPGLAASIRVLEKNGFVPVGPGSEAGTILYERKFA
jgi:ribosomal-protein-alanine N-acetyltransferase